MERQAEHYYAFGPFRLEPEQGRLSRDGLVAPLPPKTFALLLALVRNHGRLVDKEALMQELWPDAFVEEANLTFHVSVLRKTLGESASQGGGYIETVPKCGYRFRTAVKEVREKRDIKSVVVLPFSSAGSPGSDYFADGMHEALISELAQIRGLRVISRTSSQHYGTAGRPLPELARSLHVDVAVEGCVFLEGDRARIDIRLVDAREDRHLWAHSYERNLRDLLSLQRELAGTIVRQIQVRLTKREEERLGQAHPVHPEALTACLRGRYYWDHFTETSMQQAMALFQQAIQIDPGYPQAWAGLSGCHSAMAVQSMVGPRDAAIKARQAAQRAIELDPLLPDAHLTVAATRLFFDWDWLGAERAIATAIDLSPSFSQAHSLFTHYALARGWGEHAIASATRALELDPMSAANNNDLGWAYLLSGDYDKAREQLSNTLNMDFNFPFAGMYLAQVDLHEQRFDEAIAELEKILPGGVGPAPMISMLGHAQGAAGNISAAQQSLDRLVELSKVSYVSPYDRAVVYAGMKDAGGALDCLEQALADGSPRVIWLKMEPAFQTLCTHPRFQALIRRLGFEK